MRSNYSSILICCLAVVASNTVTAGQSGSDGSKLGIKTGGASQNALQPGGRNLPVIDVSSSNNVTALLGKTAYLNCRVRNLGNRTVSWVRHRDVHLLTLGWYTYTSDQRFRAIHHSSTDDWCLQIKYPQHRDAGIYECQISTTPHMSHFIYLNVVEPTTNIIGGPDLYIDRGSTINLTCVVLFSPEPPAYIFWNHNDAIISYDSLRGGVSVITEKGETTTSFLLIQNASPKDSGRYQCNPSNSQTKSINVHVLNGAFERPQGQFPEGLKNMTNRELMIRLTAVLSDFTMRIDKWDAYFDRIKNVEEENKLLALHLRRLDSRMSSQLILRLTTAFYPTSTETSLLIEDESTSTDINGETETSSVTAGEPVDNFTSTESPGEITTDPSSTESSTAYSNESSTTDGISNTSEPTVSTTDLPFYSTPPPCSGFRCRSLLTLPLIAGLVTQFPAAMQHGGQAHHRSSHLYCLIFCVCLLLFST